MRGIDDFDSALAFRPETTFYKAIHKQAICTSFDLAIVLSEGWLWGY